MDLRHILAIPGPPAGHLYPLLNLCCRVASRGFCSSITILMTEDKLDALNKMIQELEATGDMPPGVASTRRIPAANPPLFTGDEETVIRWYTDVEEIGLKALLVARELVDKEAVPVTCVLGDLLISWPLNIANKLGVSCISLHILALAEMAIALHMPTLISEGIYDPTNVEGSNPAEPIHIPGLPPLHVSDIPQVSQYPRTIGLYWDYVIGRYKQAAADAAVVLSNSCYELEGKTLETIVENHGVPLKFVGPLLRSPPKSDKGSACLSWLDMQLPSSVIYISFGSYLQWKSSELEEVLLGIQESGASFLLAFRRDVLADDPSAGLDAFLKEFTVEEVSSKPKQGMIVDWAPQVEVLNHASTGGFFTHYGWNSLAESISAGVPVIGKPALGDQFVMRKMAINEWKIAVAIEEDGGGRMTKEAVKKAVVNLMQNQEIRTNAARLKESIARALSHGGSSYNSIDELALKN